MRWAHEALGWAAVETHMDDRNEAARRLAEKLGGVVILRELFPDGLKRNVYALRPETRPEPAPVSTGLPTGDTPRPEIHG